jgi:hypothetical protein
MMVTSTGVQQAVGPVSTRRSARRQARSVDLGGGPADLFLQILPPYVRRSGGRSEKSAHRQQNEIMSLGIQPICSHFHLAHGRVGREGQPVSPWSLRTGRWGRTTPLGSISIDVAPSAGVTRLQLSLPRSPSPRSTVSAARNLSPDRIIRARRTNTVRRCQGQRCFSTKNAWLREGDRQRRARS